MVFVLVTLRLRLELGRILMFADDVEQPLDDEDEIAVFNAIDVRRDRDGGC